MYRIKFTKKAYKQKALLKQSGLDKKVKALLAVISENPYRTPPAYEKLTGDLLGAYSRRINHQHRLVYQVFEKEKAIKILSMWTHYE